ncbi:MAG: hypothetical protein FWG39_00885 [Alphaproteobacteria bacterium]|nr:hypothetical protein [Alphaproteobacteria bacterium]
MKSKKTAPAEGANYIPYMGFDYPIGTPDGFFAKIFAEMLRGALSNSKQKHASNKKQTKGKKVNRKKTDNRKPKIITITYSHVWGIRFHMEDASKLYVDIKNNFAKAHAISNTRKMLCKRTQHK